MTVGMGERESPPPPHLSEQLKGHALLALGLSSSNHVFVVRGLVFKAQMQWFYLGSMLIWSGGGSGAHVSAERKRQW